MNIRRSIFAFSIAFLVTGVGVVHANDSTPSKLEDSTPLRDAVQSITTTIATTTTTSTTTLPPTTIATTTTTTTLVPPGTRCENLASVAMTAGWPQELLVDVLDIAYNESRCINVIPGHPDYNGHDHGPMQINEVWADDVANHFGDWRYIDDIYYNFAWAWEIYRWHDERGYCGFRPWAKTAAGKCNN